MSLTEAITFLHNPPPTAALSQIQEGTHPAQIRLAREELIAHQLTVQGVRDSERRHPAPPIAPSSPAAAAFLDALPFVPTAAQQRVAIELAEDMAQTQPMLRLVQGTWVRERHWWRARGWIRSPPVSGRLHGADRITGRATLRHPRRWLTPLGQPVAWLSGRTKGQARQQVLQALASGERPWSLAPMRCFNMTCTFIDSV